MGAVGQKYNTRKGNTARLAAYRFSTLAPTNSLENGSVDFQKSQAGVKTMRQFARASASAIPYFYWTSK